MKYTLDFRDWTSLPIHDKIEIDNHLIQSSLHLWPKPNTPRCYEHVNPELTAYIMLKYPKVVVPYND